MAAQLKLEATIDFTDEDGGAILGALPEGSTVEDVILLTEGIKQHVHTTLKSTIRELVSGQLPGDMELADLPGAQVTVSVGTLVI